MPQPNRREAFRLWNFKNCKACLHRVELPMGRSASSWKLAICRYQEWVVFNFQRLLRRNLPCPYVNSKKGLFPHSKTETTLIFKRIFKNKQEIKNGVKFSPVCLVLFKRTVDREEVKQKKFKKDCLRNLIMNLKTNQKRRKIWVDMVKKISGQSKQSCKAERLETYSTLS